MKTTGKKTTKDINVQSTTRYYGYLYHMGCTGSVHSTFL